MFRKSHQLSLVLPKPRSEAVVGIFPDQQAIIRLVDANLMEQSLEWPVRRCHYMTFNQGTAQQ